jgi:hypothetical protein
VTAWHLAVSSWRRGRLGARLLLPSPKPTPASRTGG